MLQIRADVRMKYSRMRLEKMAGMLAYTTVYVHISFIDAYNYRWLLSCILYGIVERDGVVARVRNPAGLLQEV